MDAAISADALVMKRSSMVREMAITPRRIDQIRYRLLLNTALHKHHKAMPANGREAKKRTCANMGCLVTANPRAARAKAKNPPVGPQNVLVSCHLGGGGMTGGL